MTATHIAQLAFDSMRGQRKYQDQTPEQLSSYVEFYFAAYYGLPHGDAQRDLLAEANRLAQEKLARLRHA